MNGAAGNRSSLFRKTLVMMVVLFGVIATAASLLSLVELRGQLAAEYESKGTALARSLAESDLDLVLNRSLETLQSLLDQYLETPGVAYALVQDQNGEVIAHTLVPAVPESVLRAPTSTREVLVTEIDGGELGDVLHISAPILAGVAGWAHVGMDLREIRRRTWAAILRVQAMIFFIFLVSVLLAVRLVRKISGPLHDFTDYTRRLGQVDWETTEPGETTIRTVALNRNDEIGVLARSFTDLEHALRRSISSLREATATKERLEQELQIAREIQMNMLPKGLPVSEDSEGIRFDLSASLRPAREVAGDLYDFFYGADGRLYFAVGDVSGKGVPASLFMAVTTALVRSAASESADPATILARVNRQLCEDNPSCMFVTLFLGVLDLDTGVVSYCNGGHNPPFVIGRDGARQLIEGTGILLGCFPDAPYKAFDLQLGHDDGLFLFTDGLVEAIDAEEHMYGDQRLGAFLSDLGANQAAAICDSVLAALDEFTVGCLPFDDVTVMMLRYRPGARPTAAKNRAAHG